MKYIAAIVGLLLLLDGTSGAEWGYLVNESDTSRVYGVVPDAQRVIDAAIPAGNDSWEINNATYWKYWNNMQWHMKPYPSLPFRTPEVVVSHITIWDAGDHYLIGARMPSQ